jgi:hypothetical protein
MGDKACSSEWQVWGVEARTMSYRVQRPEGRFCREACGIMDESTKLLLTILIPTVTVLVGILINNRQLDQLDRHVNSQIASLRSEMLSKFETVDVRITSLRNEMLSLRNEMMSGLQRVEGVLDARLRQVEETLKLR